jgi:hypothetical protein
VTIRSVSAMRHRCTRKSEVGRKGGQNGLSCAIISAYSTRENAGIAQLVEQLICNQQVVGSNPTAGSLDFRFSIGDLRLLLSSADPFQLCTARASAI